MVLEGTAKGMICNGDVEQAVTRFSLDYFGVTPSALPANSPHMGQAPHMQRSGAGWASEVLSIKTGYPTRKEAPSQEAGP